jgi:hypothetical protein
MTFLALALGLAACGPTDPSPAVIVVRQVGAPPGPAECAEPIRQFVEVLDRDVAAGRMDQSMHTRIVGELRTVRSACDSGGEDDANHQLGVVKARYGYR